MKKIIIPMLLLTLAGCAKHRVCVCTNEHIQRQVQVDITHCPEYHSCADLNDSYLSECREQ